MLPEALSDCWAKLQARCTAPIRERQGCFGNFRDTVVSGQQVRLKSPKTKSWPNKTNVFKNPTQGEKTGSTCLFAARPWQSLVCGPGGIATNMYNNLACHTTWKGRKMSAPSHAGKKAGSEFFEKPASRDGPHWSTTVTVKAYSTVPFFTNVHAVGSM
jgi:hypothetical protein